jgi:hypothetical protein
MEIESLSYAIEKVRHRNIQKKVSVTEPKIPKDVKSNGVDWKPCEVCREEAELILKELKNAIKYG